MLYCNMKKAKFTKQYTLYNLVLIDRYIMERRSKMIDTYIFTVSLQMMQS